MSNKRSGTPPSVSEFEVYHLESQTTDITAARSQPNLARGRGTAPIAINTAKKRLAGLTNGNVDPLDDSTRWSANMSNGLLDNAEPNWVNTQNIWFGAKLSAKKLVDTVIVTETGVIGFGAHDRSAIGDWVVEVATDIPNPNDNCTLSTDGWTEVARGSAVGIGETKLISFPATPAKYIRMRTLSTIERVADHKALLETAIDKFLSGEKRELAQAFAQHFHDYNMTPRMHYYSEENVKHVAKIQHNDFFLGWIIVEKDEWHFEIFNYTQFEELVDADTDFIVFVNSQAKSCSTCHDEGCGDVPDRDVFGKKMPKLCFQHSNGVTNPTASDLEYFKKLLEYSKDIVPREEIYHCNNL